jgi:ketosteroid isomerase-like protein
MATPTPESICSEFKAAYESRDVDRLLKLYEPDTVLVGPDGGKVSGFEAVRSVLDGFLALKATIDYK